jgi:carboxyl-terminal processing protease
MKWLGNELAVDVVGMRLDDVVKRLRDLKVQTSYRKKSRWNNQIISIIRDIVEIEETYTKSSVVTKMD